MPLTGLAQPWMFPNGAADKLAVNGRVFQRNHYGTWVSYLASARANLYWLLGPSEAQATL